MPQDIGKPIDLVTIDVSFISLKLVLSPLAELLVPSGEIVTLVKPQFEVGKDLLPSDEVVKSADDRDAVLTETSRFIENETPWKVVETMRSPVVAEKGNIEFLLHLR